MAAEYLTIDDLSELLKRPRGTILNDRVRNPEALPPSITLPGTRHVLWRRQDVDTWLERLAAGNSLSQTRGSDQPLARRRGRPRKPA